MDLNEVLGHYHEQIVATWAYLMLSDRSSRYADERPDELRVLVERAANCFRTALVHDQWASLNEFIDFIARKRLREGFTVSEIQRAFEQYRETVTPLLVANIEPSSLTQVLLRLHYCVVSTVTRFSTFFQDLHEQYLRVQAGNLEREVADRTRRLAESERKYKILVEDITDGYYVLVGGLIVYANRAFAAMHGYTPDEIRGRHYLELVAAESKEAFELAYAASRNGLLSASRLEYLRLHRDGRRLPTEIMAKLSSYGGEVASIGVCRDMCQRVDLERKTREEEKLSALVQLAASLAHEINNPLTAIKMNVQMLAENEMPRQASRKLITSTLQEIEQIRRGVAEMMHLTIPFRLNHRWINLRPLIRGSLRIVDQRISYQRVRVTTRFSADVRDAFVDPERIEQALVNILINSLEALPTGGRIIISLKSSLDGVGRWILIRVADNGPGIPKEKLPYVFDPFYSQKPGGIGLGLGNVKKIVEAHGGHVTVAPCRPRGVAFTLHLPQM